MLGLTLGAAGRDLRRILAIGAHSDDIEIGCGGTLLRLVEADSALEVCWVVLSAVGERAREAQAGAERVLQGLARREIQLETFRDGFFPYQGAAIKERLDAVKAGFSPDLVLAHSRADLHQDHRLVAELAWQTFRDHLILEYEIPKYDGDLGAPNVFVPLDEALVRRKVELLLECFPSQRSKRWFTEDLFRALVRLRGVEAGAPSGYAEAFYGRKLVL